MLLTDVFEQFRKMCLEYSKSDPCHYFCSPVLSWEAMLKMTDVKLDLIPDNDIYQFIEKSMTRGVRYVAQR